MRKGREEKRGRYTIRIGEKGYSILREGTGKKGQWAPKESVVRKRYEKEIVFGKISSTTQSWIYLMGIIRNGRPSCKEGRKHLGIGAYPRQITKEKITAAIEECWSKEDVEKFLRGEEIEIKRPRYFEKNYYPIYRSLMRSKRWRKLGGLQGFVDNIVYPGKEFYAKLTGKEFIVNGNSINPHDLEKKVKSRANTGKLLTKGLIKSPDPHERKLGREILSLSKETKTTRVDLIKRMTGLEEGDIEISQGRRKQLSDITEDITEFLFRWAKLTKLELSAFISGGEIYRKKEKRKFISNLNGNSEADLRIGNQAIEVKRLLGEKFEPYVLKRVLEVYSPESKWETGEELDSTTVVFFTNPVLYETALPKLEERGFHYVGYPELKRYLENLTKILKSNWSGELKDVVPRFNNLSYIIDLTEELSLNPALIARKSNQRRREFSRKALRSLIKKAEQIQNES